MHLSLGVLARSGKADERRLAIHPEHFSRINEELRPRIRLESGYGSHFGATDDVLAPFVGSIATREEIVANELAVLPKPSALSFEAAAGITITYLTSYHALVQRANIQPGETLLVLGAAGGVGGVVGIADVQSVPAEVVGRAVAAREDHVARAAPVGADHGVEAAPEVAVRGVLAGGAEPAGAGLAVPLLETDAMRPAPAPTPLKARQFSRVRDSATEVEPSRPEGDCLLVATDAALPDLDRPRLDLNDTDAIAAFIRAHCGLDR